jgi:WS/DGAT/MGAT family acyltransferase
MTTTTKPMTAIDAAWYHIDGAVNLAMVTGILLCKEPLDFERVRAVYEHRLRKFARFRQRVVESSLPMFTPYWEDDPHFDINQHVHHVALPAPQDKAALMELISDLASTPLDHSRPLWQVHVVDNVDAGSALIMRFHHCIGDGTAMMALAEELFDRTPDAPIEREPFDSSHPEAGLLDKLFGPVVQRVEGSTRSILDTLQAGVDNVLHPSQLLRTAGIAVGGVGMLLGELLKTSDPKTPLKGEFGMRKRVAWSEPVAIEDIKTIGLLSEAKVNDVLVAGMTGALRTYLAGRGIDVEQITLRAMVPVDLRPRERGLDLGNEFGLVILELAVNSADPLERLRITKAHMDALKRSPEAIASRVLFDVFGHTPKALEDFAVDLFTSKASVVMTNVAGPRATLYLAGAPIERMMFWVPHPGRQMGMGVSMLSYKGFVSLAVVCDAHLLPDPEAITEQFGREFAEMLTLARRAHAATPQVAEEAAPPRCAAATRRGQPCKNRPLAGSAYCQMHQPKA